MSTNIFTALRAALIDAIDEMKTEKRAKEWNKDEKIDYEMVAIIDEMGVELGRLKQGGDIYNRFGIECTRKIISINELHSLCTEDNLNRLGMAKSKILKEALRDRLTFIKEIDTQK